MIILYDAVTQMYYKEKNENVRKKTTLVKSLYYKLGIILENYNNII
jgi:hypothetical protein